MNRILKAALFLVAIVAIVAFVIFVLSREPESPKSTEEIPSILSSGPFPNSDSTITTSLSDPLLKPYQPLTPAPDNTDPRLTRLQSGIVLYHPSLKTCRTLNQEEHPEDDLNMIEHLLSHYRLAFRENPVGINQEIVKQLQGDNPHNVVFLFPGEDMLSSDGELLDRWGSPYRFHAVTSTEMEIHSRGPDGELWTDDDLRIGGNHY
ncbi:MAG: hypothetical protein AAGD22_01765 [Verrucomicrobiota bacterium]